MVLILEVSMLHAECFKRADACWIVWYSPGRGLFGYGTAGISGLLDKCLGLGVPLRDLAVEHISARDAWRRRVGLAQRLSHLHLL
jgi:hypothetical protein